MRDTDREARLEEIRERLDEATPGPWEHRPNTAAGKVWVRRSGTFPWTSDVRPIFEVRDARRRGADIREEAPQKEADACLIAHAPQDIDWLLSEIDRLKAKLEAFPVTTKDEKDDSYDYETHVAQWATGDIARMLERFAAADFDHAFHAVLTEAARRLRLRQGEGGRSSNA